MKCKNVINKALRNRNSWKLKIPGIGIPCEIMAFLNKKQDLKWRIVYGFWKFGAKRMNLKIEGGSI